MLDGELHSFTAEHIFSQYDVDPGCDVSSTFIPENDTHAGVFLGNCKCLFILESMVMLEHKFISGLMIQMMDKGVRALRGYFGPPMRSKNENCFSQVSSYQFI